MPRTKRRAVAALLAIFALWPLVHYRFVQQYGLNPWKFAGWAMYTGPTYLPKIEIFELRDDGRVKIPLIGSRHAAAAATLERFRVDAMQWGRLANPDALAAQTRAALATRAPIEIVITRFFIDRSSDRVTLTRRSTFYTEEGRTN